MNTVSIAWNVHLRYNNFKELNDKVSHLLLKKMQIRFLGSNSTIEKYTHRILSSISARQKPPLQRQGASISAKAPDEKVKGGDRRAQEAPDGVHEHAEHKREHLQGRNDH